MTKIYYTEHVAEFFRNRAVNALPLEGAPNTAAPAATASFAPVPIDGDLGPCIGVTEDPAWPSNRYQWFDLADVPLGGSVRRVTAYGAEWTFTRVSQKTWMRHVRILSRQ